MDFDDDNDYGQDEEEFGDFGEPDDIFIDRLPASHEVRRERQRREELFEKKFGILTVFFGVVGGAVVGSMTGGALHALWITAIGLLGSLVLARLMYFISHAEK